MSSCTWVQLQTWVFAHIGLLPVSFRSSYHFNKYLISLTSPQLTIKPPLLLPLNTFHFHISSPLYSHTLKKNLIVILKWLLRSCLQISYVSPDNLLADALNLVSQMTEIQTEIFVSPVCWLKPFFFFDVACQTFLLLRSLSRTLHCTHGHLISLWSGCTPWDCLPICALLQPLPRHSFRYS